jgi:hypothetical protein
MVTLCDHDWYYMTVTADRFGGFTLKTVAPGEYKLYAWDEIEDGAYMDPEFMKPFASKGESVSVKEGSQLSEQLTLISAAPGAVDRFARSRTPAPAQQAAQSQPATQ